MGSDNTQRSNSRAGSGEKCRGRPRKRGKVTGRHRFRTVNKLGYEAAMDYMLEFLAVRGERRQNYVEYLATRGFDVPITRTVDAPKPDLEHYDGAEEWLVYNIQAKGWDDKGPAFVVKNAVPCTEFIHVYTSIIEYPVDSYSNGR